MYDYFLSPINTPFAILKPLKIIEISKKKPTRDPLPSCSLMGNRPPGRTASPTHPRLGSLPRVTSKKTGGWGRSCVCTPVRYRFYGIRKLGASLVGGEQ